MLVVRSALSGIAVEGTRSSSSRPLCPCGRRRHCSRGIPLVSGTSVPPLRRSPVLVSQGRVLRIRASRWITCGLPDRSPVRSRGDAVPPLAVSPQLQPGGRYFPLFDMAGHHLMRGCRPARTRRYTSAGRTLKAVGGHGKGFREACVSSVWDTVCAEAGEMRLEMGARRTFGHLAQHRAGRDGGVGRGRRILSKRRRGVNWLAGGALTAVPSRP